MKKLEMKSKMNVIKKLFGTKENYKKSKFALLSLGMPLFAIFMGETSSAFKGIGGGLLFIVFFTVIAIPLGFIFAITSMFKSEPFSWVAAIVAFVYFLMFLSLLSLFGG